MLIYLSSAKTYKIIRQIVPLPAFQNLYIRYGKEIQQERINLVNVKEIDAIVKKYIIDNKLDVTNNEVNVVCLAIDAFAFKSFSTTVMTSDTNLSSDDEIIFNNGFIFLMVPIDFRYPAKILHIAKAQNGNYNEQIDQIALEIKLILRENGLNPWFHATDGDRFLSKSHMDFFLKYVVGQMSNFLELAQTIYQNLVDDPELSIPVGDPLHLWKSIRSRYQKNLISLFADSESSTDFESAKFILDIGNALEDITQAGKMRDCYCMKLFTFQNVCKLLKGKTFY